MLSSNSRMIMIFLILKWGKFYSHPQVQAQVNSALGQMIIKIFLNAEYFQKNFNRFPCNNSNDNTNFGTVYNWVKTLWRAAKFSCLCCYCFSCKQPPSHYYSTLNSSSNFRQEHPGKNNPQMHGSTSLSLPLLPPSLLITHMLLIYYS